MKHAYPTTRSVEVHMRVSSLAIALGASLAMAGCVSTKATVLDHTVVRTEVDARSVKIYRNAQSVRGNYEEVALLNSEGDSTVTSERAMMESMRKKAAKLGANGVILDAMSEPSAVVQVVARIFEQKTSRRGKALAIFVDPAQNASAPAQGFVATSVSMQPYVAPHAPAAPAVVIVQQPAQRASAFADYSGLSTLPNAPAASANMTHSVCSRDPATGQFTRCTEIAQR
jgi:hypothetical protein